MRRLPIAAAGLVAAAVLALPWWLGGQAEGFYERNLEQVREGGWKVTASRYERGWFSSHAAAELAPARGSTDGEPVVRLDSRIHHGPWSLSAPHLLPAAAFIASQVKIATGETDSPPVLVDTVVGLDGSALSRLRTPSVTPSASQGDTRVTLAAGKGELRLAPDGRLEQAWLNLPAVRVESKDGGDISLSRLRFETEGSPAQQGLMAAKGRLTIGSISAKGPQGDLRAEGVSLSGENRPEGDLLGVRTEYRVAELVVGGDRYAPSTVVFSIRRLSAPAIKSLQQDLDKLSDEADAAVTGLAAAGILASHISPILAANPVVSLDELQIATPQGEIAGRLSVSVEGLTGQDLARRGAWLEHLVADGKLAMPEPLLLGLMTDWNRRQVLKELQKQDAGIKALPAKAAAGAAAAAAEQLDRLVRQGWLTRAQGRVASRLKLANSLLTINGKTLPLGLLGAH